MKAKIDLEKFICSYVKWNNIQDALKDQGLKCWNGEIVEIPQESEDERIKKEILDLVSISGNGNQFEEIKDWLEKQGQQKYIPKYKIGDYVKNTNYKGEPIYEIIYMDKECYICEYRGKEKMGDKAVMHFSFDNPYLRLAQKPADKVEPKFKVGVLPIEEKSPVETLCISPEEYEEMVNECIYGFDYKDANIQQKDFASKIEPKFKIGDWITNSIETVQITGYGIDYGYQVDYKGNLQHRDTDIIEKEYHLWTIADAMDGDVLVTTFDEDNMIVMYHSMCTIDTINVHCCLDNKFTRANLGVFDAEDVKPATQIQRDLLFEKMKEAGYEWDEEKKVLRKIERKLASSAKTCKNDTILDLLQKMPSCITVDGIDYHFVLKKTIAYMAFYEGEGEGSGKVIFWMAGEPIELLTEMLEKLKEEGLLE